MCTYINPGWSCNESFLVLFHLWNVILSLWFCFVYIWTAIHCPYPVTPINCFCILYTYLLKYTTNHLQHYSELYVKCNCWLWATVRSWLQNKNNHNIHHLHQPGCLHLSQSCTWVFCTCICRSARSTDIHVCPYMLVTSIYDICACCINILMCL